MARKVYRARYDMKLTVPVVVNHNQMFCEFDGGRSGSNELTGTYATVNVDIQKALESMKDFGGLFYLEKVEMMPDEVEMKNSKGKKVIEQMAYLTEEEKNKQDELEKITEDAFNPEIKSVGNIKNFQAARSYLIKELGVSINELKNKDSVLAKAKGLGIVFVDWK